MARKTTRGDRARPSSRPGRKPAAKPPRDQPTDGTATRDAAAVAALQHDAVPWVAVRNWREFQHYAGRRPPWIKFHIALLDDRQFLRLSRDAKSTLMLSWLLASRDDGRLPLDLPWMSSRLGVEVTEPQALELVGADFWEPINPAARAWWQHQNSPDASNTLAPRASNMLAPDASRALAPYASKLLEPTEERREDSLLYEETRSRDVQSYLDGGRAEGASPASNGRPT